MAKGKSHISSKKSNRCDFPFKFVNRNQPGLSMKWETQCAHRSVQTSAPPCTGIFAFLHFALLHRNFCIFALCIVAQKSFAFVHLCTGFFALDFLHFFTLHCCGSIFAFSHFWTLHCCTGILHFCIFALCIVAQAFLHFCIVALEFLHLFIFALEFLHMCIFALEFLYFCTLHCCAGIFAILHCCTGIFAFLHFALLLGYFCTSLAQIWFSSQQDCFFPLPKLKSDILMWRLPLQVL